MPDPGGQVKWIFVLAVFSGPFPLLNQLLPSPVSYVGDAAKVIKATLGPVPPTPGVVDILLSPLGQTKILSRPVAAVSFEVVPAPRDICAYSLQLFHRKISMIPHSICKSRLHPI